MKTVEWFGLPNRIELICQGTLGTDGRTIIPVFPYSLVRNLQKDLRCSILIRATTNNFDVKNDDLNETGELTEDDRLDMGELKGLQVQRGLHAKVIAICGQKGSVLYIGSSNFTRRGLGLTFGGEIRGGNANWEAGLIYVLSNRRSELIDELLPFAGPPIEVREDVSIKVVDPEREPDPVIPTFIQEITAKNKKIMVRFRKIEKIPEDLVLLIPKQFGKERYFLIWNRKPGDTLKSAYVIALEACKEVDSDLKEDKGDERVTENFDVLPWVEVRWHRTIALFPIRFDDKSVLPFIKGVRRFTEGELIDYFLYGQEPWLPENVDGDNTSGFGPTAFKDDPVDTSQILSYFIRRFVEALPGLEAEIREAMHSRPALNAVLFGPTSAIELVNKAVESLLNGPARGEPRKTPVSVGFQIVEILNVLNRCYEVSSRDEIREVIKKAIDQCRERLSFLTKKYAELKEATFRKIVETFVG